MIPKNILCISRTSFLRQYLASAGRRKASTSTLNQMNNLTPYVMSQPMRLFTYSYFRSICNRGAVNVRQLNGCHYLVSREIHTNVKESTSSEQKITPSSSKRQRKKTPPANEKHEKLVIAYPLANEVYLEKAEVAIQEQGLYQISNRPEDMTDLLHLTSKYKVDDEKLLKEFFIFREGSLVCWNVPEVERNEMIRFLLKHALGPYTLPSIEAEKESMEYTLTQNESSKVIGDRLVVKDEEQEINLDKYAFSNALSQSVKLAIWESSLETLKYSIGCLSEKLSLGKKIHMSRQEALRRLGELYDLRHDINLSSDLLDTPDFYWERDTLEELFHKSCNQLHITRRTKVLNEKLNHCCELMHLIDNKASDKQHIRLERIIIILIAVEVGFEVIRLIIHGWRQ